VEEAQIAVEHLEVLVEVEQEEARILLELLEQMVWVVVAEVVVMFLLETRKGLVEQEEMVLLLSHILPHSTKSQILE
jgi:hypothetical protein